MKKFILAILIVIILTTLPIFAKSNYYFTGDSVFSIRAGVTLPAFFAFPANHDKALVPFENTHMHPGGLASLAYQVFVTPSLALGGQIEYGFNYSNSNNLLTTIPLSGKLSYIPVQTGKFDLAFSLNLGAAFIRYNDGKYLAPFASATITPSFYFNESWGLGLETGLLTTFEVYLPNSNKNKDTCITAMMPISLVLSYRH